MDESILRLVAQMQERLTNVEVLLAQHVQTIAALQQGVDAAVQMSTNAKLIVGKVMEQHDYVKQ